MLLLNLLNYISNEDVAHSCDATQSFEPLSLGGYGVIVDCNCGALKGPSRFFWNYEFKPENEIAAVR